jgi:hypothetical protein
MKDNGGTKMERHITDEKTGISYTLHGDYYLPDLKVPENEYEIGRFGRKHAEYLKEYKKGAYSALLSSGRLNEHLHTIDTKAQELFESLMEDYKKTRGVTEQLKAGNQLEWVGRMNNIHQAVNEVVMNELIYI